MAASGTRTAPPQRGRPARAGLRAEILRTAEAEFMGRDFHAVVMDDIAKRCGVGKGTLYRYFPNKQELLQAVMRDGLLSLKEQIHGTIGSASPAAEKLADVVGAILAHFAARPGLARIVDREEGKRGVSQTRWFKSRAEVARLLAEVIAGGVADGAFKPVDPRLAAEMLLGMIRAMNRYRAAATPIAVVTRTVMSVFLSGIIDTDTGSGGVVVAPRARSGRAATAPAPRRAAAGSRRRTA